MKRGKSKSKSKKSEDYQAKLERQAENRRKLIATLDRKSALRVTQEFARLGLYQ